MDKSKMSNEQRFYFFYGYLYSKAQEMHEEFKDKTINEWMYLLLIGLEENVRENKY